MKLLWLEDIAHHEVSIKKYILVTITMNLLQWINSSIFRAARRYFLYRGTGQWGSLPALTSCYSLFFWLLTSFLLILNLLITHCSLPFHLLPLHSLYLYCCYYTWFLIAHFVSNYSSNNLNSSGSFIIVHCSLAYYLFIYLIVGYWYSSYSHFTYEQLNCSIYTYCILHYYHTCNLALLILAAPTNLHFFIFLPAMLYYLLHLFP
jgi:hypothetical protein